MRFCFSSIERPKAAAKWLCRLKSDISLGKALEAIASATGYRDWFELSHTKAPHIVQQHEHSIEIIRDVILSIANTLAMDIGDVHFAVSKSRLMRDVPMPIEQMLQLRAMLWRARLFGISSRGKPGTVVRVKSLGENTIAYLKAPGRPTHIILDNGVGIRADFEVITPHVPLSDFVPSRLWLPYGVWELVDGSTVTFSRDYMPLWHNKGDQVIRMDPWTWVTHIVDQRYFPGSTASEIAWDKDPARSRAIRHLKEFRLFDPPKLLDAMPYLFEKGIETVGDAVTRLQEVETAKLAA